MTPFALALALTFAAPEPTSVEEAVARAIDVALPDDEYGWSMDWSPFGVRLGREVRWHLSEPGEDDEDDLGDQVYRRVGWLSHEGATADLAVCGDRERVRALSLSMSHLQMDGAGVAAALEAVGIETTEILWQDVARPASADDPRVDEHYRSMLGRAPALQRWSLHKPGHGDATLSAEHVCTPPGTRHATHCRTRLQVQFHPADAHLMTCPLPGLWGG